MLPVQTKQTLKAVESESARSKVMVHSVAVSTPQHRWLRDFLPRCVLATIAWGGVWREL